MNLPMLYNGHHYQLAHNGTHVDNNQLKNGANDHHIANQFWNQYSPQSSTPLYRHSTPSSIVGSCKNANNGTQSSAELVAELNNYKYLDDYEYCLQFRLKRSAMRKFASIMQSIDGSVKSSTNNNDDQLESNYYAQENQLAFKDNFVSSNSSEREGKYYHLDDNNHNFNVANEDDYNDEYNSDINGEKLISEFSVFNKILKRHRRRLKQNFGLNNLTSNKICGSGNSIGGTNNNNSISAVSTIKNSNPIINHHHH